MDLHNLLNWDVVALTIFGEAEGEPIEGQIAVGIVIRNRVRLKNMNYATVCLEPKQFSCWNDDSPRRIILENLAEQLTAGVNSANAVLKQCIYIAKGIVTMDLMSNVGTAQNYMTTELYNSTACPLWAKNLMPYKVIGRHTFLV